MDRAFTTLGKLSWLMASLAKLALGFLVVIVVVDVCLRNLGMRPLSWGVSFSEYCLLYAAFLPMPWLVRTKGHVFVEFIRAGFPPNTKKILEKTVYLLCIAIGLYLGTYALISMISTFLNADYETRSFDMPKWLIYLPIFTAFYLSALEWLRYLFGRNSLYTLDPLEIEGL